jgi:hypothetical protein
MAARHFVNETREDVEFFVFGCDPSDGSNKVRSTCIEGEMVFGAGGPHPPD